MSWKGSSIFILSPPFFGRKSKTTTPLGEVRYLFCPNKKLSKQQSVVDGLCVQVTPNCSVTCIYSYQVQCQKLKNRTIDTLDFTLGFFLNFFFNVINIFLFLLDVLNSCSSVCPLQLEG